MTPIRLLIAEDNPSDAELLVRELRRCDFEVSWERVDTEPAFKAGLQAGIDLVLSDYEMPGFGGLRALEIVQKSGLEVPFIIVSGTIGEETAVAAMKFGAADYLLKDRLSRLGGAVAQALAGARLRRERRAMEAAKATAEAKYRTMFENSTEGLYRTTADGCLLLANATLARIAGYASAAEMVACAENVAEEFYDDPADHARFKAQMQADGLVRGFETRMRGRDGSLCWISVNAQVMADELGNRCYEGAVQDITARKAAEEKMRDQLDELRRWHAVTLGREERIMGLKAEVNALLRAAGAEPRYGGDGT